MSEVFSLLCNSFKRICVFRISILPLLLSRLLLYRSCMNMVDLKVKSLVVLICCLGSILLLNVSNDYSKLLPRYRPASGMKQRSKYLIYGDQVIPSMNNYIIKKKCMQRNNVTIIVTSAPDYFHRRDIIRETYADIRLKKQYNFNVFFALGMSENHALQKLVKDENDRHQDIIQWNFIDNYNNNTIKSLALLDWAANFCIKSSYILKADDDTYVNVFNLHTNGLFNLKEQNVRDRYVLYGMIGSGKVIRDPEHKWYIPKDVIQHSHYPIFAQGSGYMMTQVTASILFKCSMANLPLLVIDDVAITGIARENCPVPIETMSQSYYFLHVMLHDRTLAQLSHGIRSKQSESAEGVKFFPAFVILSNHIKEPLFRKIHSFAVIGARFSLDDLRGI